jgi:hypothetical protein
MATDYAGFTPQDLAAYFGVSGPQAQAILDLTGGGALSAADQQALQGLPVSRFGTGGDIQGGLQHLEEHPKGSHYHGDFNPTDMLANIATGGLYGFGQAAYKGLSGQQDLFGAARGGLNQLGPWGSSTYNIPGYGHQIAETGNLIGAGAGIGAGGFSSFSPAGFGAEGASAGGAGAGAGAATAGGAARGAVDPIYFGFEPGTLESAGTTEFGQFAGGVPGAGFSGGAAGALGGAVGSPGTGALLGGSLAQMLGGASPLAAFPQSGAGPGGGG